MTIWTALLIAILFWVVGVPVLILVVKFIVDAWKWSVGKPVSTGVVHPRIDNRQVIPVQTLPDTIPMDVRGNAICSPNIIDPITVPRRGTTPPVPVSTPSYTPAVRPRTRQRAVDTRVTYTWESMHLNDSRAAELMYQLTAHPLATVKIGFKSADRAYSSGAPVAYEIRWGHAWHTATGYCNVGHVEDKKYYVEMELYGGMISPGRYRLYKYSPYEMDVGDAIILDISYE